MNLKTLYRQARAHGVPASTAIMFARRFIAGPLADYREKMAAWEAEPDKRRYAPGGIANRPKMPTFYRDPSGVGLREVDKPGFIDHNGWFADDMQENIFIPKVWRLTHGRMIAGYESSAWDTGRIERKIYTDDAEAWRAADHMAERDAEKERDYCERWNAAQRVNDDREQAREALQRARAEAGGLVLVLRELPQTAESRATICRLVRECRQRMAAALTAINEATDTLAEYAAEGIEV